MKQPILLQHHNKSQLLITRISQFVNLLVMSIIILIGGCTATVKNDNFELNTLKKIIKNETSKQQVINLFGKPASVEKLQGSEIFYYIFKSQKEALIPLLNCSQYHCPSNLPKQRYTSKFIIKLTIHFSDDGLVNNLNYIEINDD